MSDEQDTADQLEEQRDRVRQVVPPAVYLPVAPGGEEFHEVEMRVTNDGRVALLAYTALDRLADGQGPHQPWVLYPTDRIEELGESQPYDVVYLDLAVPQGLWRREDGTQPQPDAAPEVES